MENITGFDVAYRIYRGSRKTVDRCWQWYDESDAPTFTFEGKDKTFGKLTFYFKSSILRFSVFVQNRKKIIDSATDAIENYDKYLKQILEFTRDAS